MQPDMTLIEKHQLDLREVERKINQQQSKISGSGIKKVSHIGNWHPFFLLEDIVLLGFWRFLLDVIDNDRTIAQVREEKDEAQHKLWVLTLYCNV